MQDNLNQNVLITGASGFIGLKITEALVSNGYSVYIVTRNKNFVLKHTSEKIHLLEWGELNNFVVPMTTIINLAGENIGQKRWTSKQKKLILKSRIDSTQKLVDFINKQKQKPSLFISASAIGFYGDRGEETLTEISSAGNTFLSTVCDEWENSAKKLNANETRLVILRLGLVIDNTGGVFPKLKNIARMGLASPVGFGNQWVSFIHINDLINLVLETIKNTSYSGTINAVSDTPIRQKNLMKELAHSLRRPYFPIGVPQIFLKLILGEMSELVLDSQRVQPAVLKKNHFQFRYRTFKDCLL